VTIIIWPGQVDLQFIIKAFSKMHAGGRSFVTGLAKTRIVCTKTETYFIALVNNYTHEVSMHSVSTGPDELVCFS